MTEKDDLAFGMGPPSHRSGHMVDGIKGPLLPGLNRPFFPFCIGNISFLIPPGAGIFLRGKLRAGDEHIVPYRQLLQMFLKPLRLPGVPRKSDKYGLVFSPGGRLVIVYRNRLSTCAASVLQKIRTFSHRQGRILPAGKQIGSDSAQSQGGQCFCNFTQW